MTPSPAGVDAMVAAALRDGDREAYWTTLLAPPAIQPHLAALYAFAHEISQVRRRTRGALTGEIRLQWWRDALAGTAHGAVASNPVAAALLATLDRYALPRESFVRFVDAHRAELYDEDGLETPAALDAYLDETDGLLIAILHHILGGLPAREDALRSAGRAIGLTRLAMALRTPADRRDLLIPRTWLDDYGASRSAFLDGRTGDSVRAVVRHLAEEADRNHAQARTLLGGDPALRIARLPLVLVPLRLKALARAGYDPYAVVPPSSLKSLWALWRAA